MSGGDKFSEEINKKEERAVKAREKRGMSTLQWIGMLGIIGWSVTIPLLLGVFIGKWIDGHYPGPRSFTLMFLFAGLVTGCWNAWYWVRKEIKRVTRPKTQDPSQESQIVDPKSQIPNEGKNNQEGEK